MTTNDKALVARVREVAANLREIGQPVNDDMMKMPERLVMPRTVPLTLELAADRLEELSRVDQ